ncbi:MAG: hypothetical protein KC501_22005 [Myxococcales bacterium]|nr:hypothetical protein [Myxococcales bacterium]
MLTSPRARRRPVGSTLLGLAVALAPTLGCGDEGCDEDLRICSIDSADCQEHVFVQTACARGHAGRTPPPVSSITRDQLEDLLRGGEPPTAEQGLVDAQIATSLRMLGLLPPGETSSEEAAIQAFARSVLAFYTRETGSVTIVETNLGEDPETEVFVLSHEFVHAQQDVDVGLQDFFDTYAGNGDQTTATRSVTEGEAVLYSNLTMARQPGASITAEIFADYYAQQQQSLRDAAGGDPDTEVGYTDLSSVFPYPFGGQLVTDRWLADGNAGVLELYDDPPRSTAAILRTVTGKDPLPEDPVTASVGPLPDGYSVIAEDTMGAWIVYAFVLRNRITEPTASSLAEGWLGDQIVVAGGAAQTDVALVWTVRFADETLASRFAAIDGVSPPEGARSVRVAGRDVIVVMASDPAQLESWESVFPAAVVPRSPSLVATPPAARGPRLRPPPVHEPRLPRAAR